MPPPRPPTTARNNKSHAMDPNYWIALTIRPWQSDCGGRALTCSPARVPDIGRSFQGREEKGASPCKIFSIRSIADSGMLLAFRVPRLRPLAPHLAFLRLGSPNRGGPDP